MSTNQIRTILFQNLAPFLDDKDVMIEINNFILKLNERRNGTADMSKCYSKKEMIALATRRADELKNGQVAGIENQEVFKQIRNIL